METIRTAGTFAIANQDEFIEKIIVHAPEKIDWDRVQEVEIYLKIIGRFELPEPELTQEEIKRQEQLRRTPYQESGTLPKNQGW